MRRMVSYESVKLKLQHCRKASCVPAGRRFSFPAMRSTTLVAHIYSIQY